MKRGILAVLALALVTVAACSKNEAATEKCKASADSASCEACCKTNGASGYSYASTCGCLGGS
jgi:hypothetical protein